MCDSLNVKQGKIGHIEGDLDEKDWILLEAVQSDARLSYASLGRMAGLSAPAAAERLRRLEDAGVIRGYHADVDVARLGLPMLVMMDVRVQRSEYGRFQKVMAGLNWILECHHVTGRAKAAVPNVEGLEQLIGHLSQFGDTTTSVVLSTAVRRRAFAAGRE